jgi:hypothetical protein
MRIKGEKLKDPTRGLAKSICHYFVTIADIGFCHPPHSPLYASQVKSARP